MMKTYEALRKRCYEIIYPDGIPLEAGCLVMASLCFEDDRGEPIDDYNMDRFIIGPDDKIEQNEVNHLDYIIHNQREYSLYNNLGPDLTLQSILRAIRMKAKRNFHLEMCIALDLHIAVDDIIVEYETGRSVREQPEKILQQFLSLLTEGEY